jgi:hypothetical protein
MLALALLLALGTAQAAQAAQVTRSYMLRWPARANVPIASILSFPARNQVRAIGLKVYGSTVPPGYVYDNIVACAHRGPASLDWDWAQTGGHVYVKVMLTSGSCDLGPTVAGKYVKLTLTIS